MMMAAHMATATTEAVTAAAEAVATTTKAATATAEAMTATKAAQRAAMHGVAAERRAAYVVAGKAVIAEWGAAEATTQGRQVGASQKRRAVVAPVVADIPEIAKGPEGAGVIVAVVTAISVGSGIAAIITAEATQAEQRTCVVVIVVIAAAITAVATVPSVAIAGIPVYVA